MKGSREDSSMAASPEVVGRLNYFHVLTAWNSIVAKGLLSFIALQYLPSY